MAGLEWLQAAGTAALAHAVAPSGERRLGGAEMEVAAALIPRRRGGCGWEVVLLPKMEGKLPFIGGARV